METHWWLLDSYHKGQEYEKRCSVFGTTVQMTDDLGSDGFKSFIQSKTLTIWPNNMNSVFGTAE